MNKVPLTEIIKVDRIKESRSYWFIRTDSGENFEHFLAGNYIGIGWNKILLTDIVERSLGAVELKDKIAKTENIDSTKTKGKSNVTGIATKLIRFVEGLKKDDFVIIPSRGSSRLAFGEVKESKVYVDINDKDKCPYYKRKKIIWHDVKNLNDLDPIYYKIIQSRHAISNIDKYASYLDKSIKTLYTKGEFSHLIINVKAKKDISYSALFNTWPDLINLSSKFATEYGYGFDKNGINAKINVQSPGNVEIIVNTVETVIIIALMVGCITGIDFQIDSEYIKAHIKIKSLADRITIFLNNKANRDALKVLSENMKEMKTESKDVTEAMKILKE